MTVRVKAAGSMWIPFSVAAETEPQWNLTLEPMRITFEVSQIGKLRTGPLWFAQKKQARGYSREPGRYPPPKEGSNETTFVELQRAHPLSRSARSHDYSGPPELHGLLSLTRLFPWPRRNSLRPSSPRQFTPVANVVHPLNRSFPKWCGDFSPGQRWWPHGTKRQFLVRINDAILPI
jgi:hypothetical protein